MSSIQRTKKIGLVDCNSFYVSCERLFNPKIRRKPVVVLSNNDGCIISRSNEAKALGIKMGEPYFKAKDIIVKNKVEVFSSNYSLYGDLSRRVMRTLKRFNTEIEVYSIDEAFIDLSNFPDSEVEKVGREIRETVLQWTGIPTSIGIAKTKTLSKVANHIAKKKQSGVTSLIGIENLDPILEKVEINDVWGVGRQLTKFYQKNGIYNAKQLKNKSNTWIKKCSNVLSSRTAMELRGVPCIDLETTQTKLVRFKEIMVIIQIQKLSTFQLQQTIVLRLLKLQSQYLRVYLGTAVVIKKQELCLQGYEMMMVGKIYSHQKKMKK